MAKTAAEIPGPDGGGEFHQNQEIFNFINSDQIFFVIPKNQK